ncbi:hypothetical protein EVJ50_01410 [Synechococcus sp. RSCCF101]|uniref:calcium-binding protein n=1 Tax=Synechococcus sp. RSCCF101 TaxID=2511069 RepID=UPI0012487B5D|nr:hypothetical protein [Synechococcus sp. RSCCF101]QEY31109.1 hypothetical protein EVJ50_01410 [Synechococcus sp. RSCCF101]
MKRNHHTGENGHYFGMGDRIDGGLGNDRIFGMAGDDWLNGSQGNDVIFSGTDSDTLIGGDGDDWLIVDTRRNDSDRNVLTGGNGYDTFMLAPMTGNDWVQLNPGSTGTSFAESNQLDIVLKLASLTPAAPAFGTLGTVRELANLFGAGESATPPSLVLNWPASDLITDFNPFQDTLMLNFDPKSLNFDVIAKSDDSGFLVKQEIKGETNSLWATLADVTWDQDGIMAYTASLGLGAMSIADMKKNAWQTTFRSRVEISGTEEKITLGSGDVVEFKETDNPDALNIGDGNGVVIMGANGGSVIKRTAGDPVDARFMGTDFGDTLYLFNNGTGVGTPDMNRVFAYGLGGDDIIMAGGGSNYIYGGAGSDWVSYDYDTNAATQGIVARMDLGYVNNGIRQWDQPDLPSEAQDRDYIFEVENLIGSRLDDLIIGNHYDNTIKGGAGNDRIMGYAGNNTLYGEEGNDVLGGTGQKNFLYGGDGRDILLGGSNSPTPDSLYGESGADGFLIRPGRNLVEDFSTLDGDTVIIDTAVHRDVGLEDIAGGVRVTAVRIRNGAIDSLDLLGVSRAEFQSYDRGISTAHQLDLDADDPWLQITPANGAFLGADGSGESDTSPNGGDGSDPITGEGGPGSPDPHSPDDPVIHGGSGDDQLFGTASADRFVWSAGQDEIHGFTLLQGDVFQIAAGIGYSLDQVGANSVLSTEFGTTTLLQTNADDLMAQGAIQIV